MKFAVLESMFIPAHPLIRRGLFIKETLRLEPFPVLKGHQIILRSAREALYHGLCLMNPKPKRAHVPAFICESALQPLYRLNIELNYYDVNERFEPMIDEISLRKGDIFILVHYFGIPQHTANIRRMCSDGGGIYFVEDCAHTLPDPGAVPIIGSESCFSYFSLRKMLPVPDGAVLVVNDKELCQRVAWRSKPEGLSESWKSKLIYLFESMAFRCGLPGLEQLRSFLKCNSKVCAKENGKYYSDPFSLDTYPDIKSVIHKVTWKTLFMIDYAYIARTRRDNYRYLQRLLENVKGINFPFPELPSNAVPQALPVFLRSLFPVWERMRKKGIGVTMWPAKEMPKRIFRSDFPLSFRINEKLLLLPIHQDMNTSHLEFVAETLCKFVNECSK